MKIFTYSEARQNLAKVLTMAQTEEVEIRRKDGSVFSLKAKQKVSTSPFAVEGISSEATTAEIISAVRKSRSSN